METQNLFVGKTPKLPKKLSFTFDSKGIPLSFLIQLHNKYVLEKKSATKTLKDNIGDAFLYHENPIFRNIRDEYLKRGFRFSTVDFCDYNTFPLMALDELIDTGKIPYLRNFRWLERLHEACPGRFTSLDLQQLQFRFNSLLHESAHLIAHDVFFGDRSLKNIPKNEDSLLQILANESFSNAVDTLVWIFPNGTVGFFFLFANSRAYPRAEELSGFMNLIKKYGISSSVRLIFAWFLYYNYLYSFLEVSELKQIREFAEIKLEADLVKDLGIFNLGTNTAFRTKTTPFHLFKIGFDQELSRLIDRDPFELLNEPGLGHVREKIDLLLAILQRNMPSCF
jgi:hypothetical protein